MKEKSVIILASIIVLVASCFVGCDQSENGTKKAITACESYCYFTDGTADRERGIYVGEDQLLHYYDIHKQEEMVLCNKPDCQHEPYDDETNRDPTCEAALNESMANFCYPLLSGNDVYLVGSHNLSSSDLYRQSITGGNREKIGTFPYAIQQGAQCYVRNHTAYILASIPIVREDKIGGVGSNQSQQVFIELDLTTAAYKVISKEHDAEWQGLNLVGINGKEIYYQFSYSEKQKKMSDYKNARSFDSVYTYDMDTGKTTEVLSARESNGYDIIGLFDGKICVCQKEAKTVCVYEADKKKMEKIYQSKEKEASFLSTSKYLFKIENGHCEVVCGGKKATLKKTELIVNCFEDWCVCVDSSGKDCGQERIITIDSLF